MATAARMPFAFARPRVSRTPLSARFGKGANPRALPKPTVVRLGSKRVSVKTFAAPEKAPEGNEDEDPESPEQSRQPKPGEQPATYQGVDISGGKYGMGESIDKGLDATTNPDSFLFGFVFLCSFAVLAFLFGPKPPSDYYG